MAPLKQLVLEGHLRLRLQTNASTEDVDQCRALLAQSIDDRCTRRCHGCLEHVAENAQNAVESLVIGLSVGLPGDTGHHLGDQDQVDDQRRCQERVLADVEQADGLVSTAEDLGVVLVQSALVVADSGHVLDDDGVVGMLLLIVEDLVGSNHVVNHVGLGNLLGAELLLGAQVLAVVVAQVVVAGNRGELDTGVDQEVHKGRLHLGLARLEVITANVGTLLLGKVNSTRDEGVLGRTVDERSILQNRSHGEDSGWSNFQMTSLDGVEEVVRGVVDARDDVGVTLSVGSPHDNDLVEAIVGLELANVLLDVLDMSPASLGALNHIVGPVLLVGGDEVGVVDTGKRLDLGHFLAHQLLETRLEDLSPIHSVGQVHAADIPATHDEIVGVGHGEHIMEGNIDLIAGLGIGTQLDGRAHDNGAVVIGGLFALTGLPGEATTVGNETSSHSGTVVSTQTDHHDTEFAHLAVDLEVVGGRLGSSDQLVVGGARDVGGVIGILGLDLIVGIDHIGRVDGEKGSRTRPVHGASGSNIRTCVGSHCVG